MYKRQLLDNGIPRFVVYWRNEIRKAIYPTPRNNISFEDYIEGVRSIEELANAVFSEKEIPDCVAKIIALTMYKVSVYRYDSVSYTHLIHCLHFRHKRASIYLNRINSPNNTNGTAQKNMV